MIIGLPSTKTSKKLQSIFQILFCFQWHNLTLKNPQKSNLAFKTQCDKQPIFKIIKITQHM